MTKFARASDASCRVCRPAAQLAVGPRAGAMQRQESSANRHTATSRISTRCRGLLVHAPRESSPPPVALSKTCCYPPRRNRPTASQLLERRGAADAEECSSAAACAITTTTRSASHSILRLLPASRPVRAELRHRQAAGRALRRRVHRTGKSMLTSGLT
jgi:hypothetical protein